MSSIKTVALAGATGALGPTVLQTLVDDGFEVTVLSRDANKVQSSLPAKAKAVTVDYTSLESLKAALKGQDAVVSTLSAEAGASQNLLIDAAAAVGVQRFLPSEFGCDYATTSHIAVFQDKVKARKYVEEVAQKSSLTYTYISNGGFLDWGLNVGFLLSLNAPSVEVWDGGDVVFSTTTVAGIAKAVSGVLKHPAETKNRALFISEANVTQNKILELAKKETGKEWKVEQVSGKQRAQEASDELKKDKPDMTFVVHSLIKHAIFGDPELHGAFLPDELDNELLGLKTLGEEEVSKIVKAAIK
ncbi:hypothetical protein FH972_021291 [Carpinus fangiana]|uniref:NmrA-like domain-containing protein n=1 Tax=Carpinus fangiana TaxID=176857 RepID=A0A5N6KR33_9ROSI|nr:hypothetical protein FH972_021291 [Carpinus fangiana]